MPINRLLPIFLCFWVLLPLLGFAQDPRTLHADLQLGEVQVAETSSDHVKIAVRVSVRTHERAKITRFALNSAYFNGMPVFFNPIEQPFEVVPNEFVQLPGELTATIYYRDVDSSAPLEQLLENSSVKVAGEATITAQLKFVQKLALLASTATSKVPFQVTVPVELPGGELGRNAALLVLRAARPLFGVARKASESAGIGPRPDPWGDQKKHQYENALLYVVSRYQLRDKHGSITEYSYTGTGFRLNPSQFVLLREALAPWNFNPEALAHMKSNGAKVVAGSEDIVVYSPGAIVGASRSGLSLRQGDFRVIAQGKEERKRIFVKSDAGYKGGRLDERAAEGNIAVLEFTSPSAGVLNVEFAQPSDSLDPISILRFKSVQSGESLQVEIIPIHARRNGDSLELTDPVDTRSFGSPVLVSSGILGVVQDERSAALLRPSLKHVGYMLVSLGNGPQEMAKNTLVEPRGE